MKTPKASIAPRSDYIQAIEVPKCQAGNVDFRKKRPMLFLGKFELPPTYLPYSFTKNPKAATTYASIPTFIVG